MSTATNSKGSTSPKNRMPLAEAALRLGINRERLLRCVQGGVVPGGRENGFWYVDVAAIESPTLAGAA